MECEKKTDDINNGELDDIVVSPPSMSVQSKPTTTLSECSCVEAAEVSETGIVARQVLPEAEKISSKQTVGVK